MPKYGDLSNSQQGPYCVYVPKYGDVNTSQQLSKVHIVFPPSEHDNLPIESELDGLTNTDVLEGSCVENFVEGGNEPHQKVDTNHTEKWMTTVMKNMYVGSASLTTNEITGFEPKLSEIQAKQEKNKMCSKSDLPSEGWRQKKSTCVFHRRKGVTTVSMVVAGALAGFIIMGQSWQQDRLHLHEFQFSVSG